MILNFKTQRQLLGNWCWSAIASSISLYYNPNSPWRQNVLAARLIDTSCILVNAGSIVNAPSICDVQMDVAGALAITGNLSGDIIRPLIFNEVIQQINSGFPICCQIVFPNSSGSHFVALYGYQSTNIIIGDPQAGIFSIDYNQFRTDYRGGTWERTIGTKKNIINT